MNEVVVEEIGPCRNRIKITIPAESVREEIEKQYQELQKSVQFPGFRRGHTPQKLLEKRFGEEVLESVKETLITKSLEDAIKEKNLDLISEPDLDPAELRVSPEVPLNFEVTVELRPRFEVKDYRGLPLAREPVTVGPPDVDAALQGLARRRATLDPVEDGPVAAGDVVLADARIEVEGEVEDHAGTTIDPETQFVGGIYVGDVQQKLVGQAQDGRLEVSATVSRFHPRDDWRGKAAKIELTVREIKRINAPPVDEALAKDLDYDSLAELRERTESEVRAVKERDRDRALEERALDLVLEKTPFDVPDGLVERERERQLHTKVLALELMGVSNEEIQKEITGAAEWPKDELVRALRRAFLMEAIADAEKIFVTEPEVDAAIEDLARSRRKTAEEVREEYDSRDLMSELRRELRWRKVRRFLRENADIKDAPAGAGTQGVAGSQGG
jgi:trigger factor